MRVGERRQRDGVGAEEHLAVAVADRQRRALARADQQVVLAGEQEGERKRAAQPRQRRLRPPRPASGPCFISLGDQMRDDLGVGLAWRTWRRRLSSSSRSSRKFSMMPLWTTATPLGGVRMGVGLGRLAVGRPAGVADADGAGERLSREPVFEIAQLALGAPARQLRRLPASRRPRNRSRGIRGASARRPASRRPARARECRQFRTCASSPARIRRTPGLCAGAPDPEIKMRVRMCQIKADGKRDKHSRRRGGSLCLLFPPALSSRKRAPTLP